MSDKMTHLGGVALDNSNTDQPTINGEIKYVSGTGFRAYANGAAFTIGAGSGSTAYDDIGDPDSSGSISFGAYTGTYTSSNATWGGLIVSNTNANPGAGASLLNLTYDADGDAQGIYITCKDNSAADTQFQVGANGAITTEGDFTLATNKFTVAAATGNTLVAGTLDVTSDLKVNTNKFVVTASTGATSIAGQVDIAADSIKLTLGAAAEADSYIVFDGTDLIFYDSNLAAERTLSQLTGAGTYNSILDPDGNGSIDFTTYTNTWVFAGTGTFFTITANSLTTGNLISATANALTSGSMIYLESSAAGMAGEYIRCYDGAADDFVVGANGAVAIAGNAKGTDAITITAGDITLTSGDCTLSDGDYVITEGKITVATVTDETSSVIRNLNAATSAVVEIEATHTGDVGLALLIDHNGTGAASAVTIDHEGTADCLTITSLAAAASLVKATAEAATGTVFEAISAASATVSAMTFANSGTGATGWLGADGVGMLHLACDGNLAHANASCLLIEYSGTGAATGLGTSLRIVDTGATATSYAAYISAATGEALYIDAGKVQIDEDLTLSADGTAVDFTAYSGAAGNYVIWDGSEAELRVAGAAILAIGGTPGAKDGLTIDFDGADVDIDAVTANDNIKFGSDVDTNVIFNTASGAAMTIDHGADTITVSATTIATFTGNGTGDGLVIPSHATNSPSDTTTASIFFEIDANKLWVYNGVGWVGTTLA